jgi:hypothetical protein
MVQTAKSYVHLQEDYIAHAVLYSMFFMHLCKQPGSLQDVLDIGKAACTLQSS